MSIVKIIFLCVLLFCACCRGESSSHGGDVMLDDKLIVNAIHEATEGRSLDEATLRAIYEGVMDIKFTDKSYDVFKKRYEKMGLDVPVKKKEFVDAEVKDLIPLLKIKEYEKLIVLLNKKKLLPPDFKANLPELYEEYKQLHESESARQP